MIIMSPVLASKAVISSCSSVNIWHLKHVFFQSILTLALSLLAQGATAATLVAEFPKTIFPIDPGSGQVQVFTIPIGIDGELFLQLEGGDGGNARWEDSFYPLSAFGIGGPGARVEAVFSVGPGPDQLPPGSTLKFILGKKGTSGNEKIVDGESEPAKFDVGSAGAGGGGTGVYVQLPDTAEWILLVGAGGGSGAWASEYLLIGASADGRYGRYTGDDYGPLRNGGDGGGTGFGDGGLWDEVTQSGGGGGRGDNILDDRTAPGGGGTKGNGFDRVDGSGSGGRIARGDTMVASLGGVDTSSSDVNGGSGWGGGGAGGDGLFSGGGGGGVSGGGGGGVIPLGPYVTLGTEGGGGGSYYSSRFSAKDQRVVKRSGQSESRLPVDGLASYAFYPVAGSRVFTEDTIITTRYTLFEIQSWVINPGVVLTLEPAVDLRVEGLITNFGTIVNRGSIEVFGGTIENKAGGVINSLSIGVITNIGTILNSGDIYTCFLPIIQDAPIGNPSINGCLVSPDSGGGKTCTLMLDGAWDGANTCTITEELQWSTGYSLTIGAGSKLELQNTLTNYGEVINLGSIGNTNGVFNDCGDYSGVEPDPNPRLDCELSPAGGFCTSVLDGEWNETPMICRIDDHTVLSGITLHLNVGFTLEVNGTLENFGTINHEGTIINLKNIRNNEGASFNNHGVVINEYATDIPQIYNAGVFTNYGSLQVGDGIFDNDNVGDLFNACGSQYSGNQPINNEHGGVFNDECPDLIFHSGFEPGEQTE